MMVIGHAEGPSWLLSVIFLFHMPLFFITSGYFFSRRYISQPWEFCVKRVKGLYVPFVKWSVLFLLLHNIFFHIGILNEQYGNWEGGVTHPYSLNNALQRLFSIFFQMGGYDEFIAGAFWFFRALFIVSIAFIILRVVLESRETLRKNVRAEIVIVVGAFLLALLMGGTGLKIQSIVQGGMREVCGLFFFSIGVIYRHYEHRIPKHWLPALLTFFALCWCASQHYAGMNYKLSAFNVFTLSITGCLGFYLLHCVSQWLSGKQNIFTRFLNYCGENTMPIFVFHILAYKVVSLMKIWYYGLDIKQIGCHMVIHDHHDDYFWVLYTIVGVGLPLLCTFLRQRK